MTDLIVPHGDLAEPICCTVSKDEIPAFTARAAKLAKVPVSDADLSTVYRWGDGTAGTLDASRTTPEARVKPTSSSLKSSRPLARSRGASRSRYRS